MMLTPFCFIIIVGDKTMTGSDYSPLSIVIAFVFLVAILILLAIVSNSDAIDSPKTTKGSQSIRKVVKPDDDSIFGIDWDGDGEASMEDDMLTMEVMEDDFL